MAASISHYNTTHEQGELLFVYREKARTQEERILAWYRRNPTRSFSPSQVRLLAFEDPRPEITSVRRAITNLCKAGSLAKTTDKVMGPHGRPEYTWILA